MTRDEHSSRRAEAQRVADALGDLFDGVAPSNRAAAEEELRDAGIDPNRVAQRTAATATRALAGSDAGSQPSRRAAQRHPRDTPQRGAAAPNREDALQRSPRAEVFGRLAAVLMVGIAIGWLLGRSATPAPRIQPVEVARMRQMSPSDEQAAGVAESARDPGDSSDANAKQVGENRRTTTDPSQPADGTNDVTESGTQAGADNGGNAAQDEVAPQRSQIGPEHEEAEEVAGAGEDMPAAWVLNQSNYKQARDMLPSQVLQHVKSGEYWFTVQPTAPAAFRRKYSRRFWTATGSNAQKYEIDHPSICGLREAAGGGTPDFYFGFPFPEISRDDPFAACKIMWNVNAARAISGSQESVMRWEQLVAGERDATRRLQIEFHWTMFLGRESGPIANPYALRSAVLGRATSPSELAGTTFLTRRPNATAIPDQTWAYIPSVRRVRAVSPAQRSEGWLGSDLSLDELDCFDGKLEEFKWYVVGSQTVLAPMTNLKTNSQTQVSPTRAQVKPPLQRAAFELEEGPGAPWLMVDNLVMTPRPVWVVEGVPRDSVYAVGKFVLYVDQELYRTYWRVAFSRKGEYVAHTMCAQHWSRGEDGALATATANALMAVNETLPRATLARSTAQSFDQELGNEFFTLSTAIQTAH